MMDEVRARLQEASEREEFNSGGDVLALLGDDIRAVLEVLLMQGAEITALRAEVVRLRAALEQAPNTEPFAASWWKHVAMPALRGEGEKP